MWNKQQIKICDRVNISLQLLLERKWYPVVELLMRGISYEHNSVYAHIPNIQSEHIPAFSLV